MESPGPAGLNSIYWPADLLPSAVPRARIWTYGYNADVFNGFFQANNQNSILRHGRDFMEDIEQEIKDDVSLARTLSGA